MARSASRRAIDWSHALAAAEPPPRTPEEAEPKDFNVHVKVRNGRLLAAIRKAGYPSILAFAKACGLPNASVSAFVTMRRPPYSTVTGLPTEAAQKLADMLNTEVTAIFPPRVLATALANASRPVDLNLSDDQIQHFLQQPPVTPEQYLQLADAQAAVAQQIATLTPRSERALRLRYGIGGNEREHTLEEASAALGVTKERVRQIEIKGIDKLRVPSRKYHLVEAAHTFGLHWYRVPKPAEKGDAPTVIPIPMPRVRDNPPPTEHEKQEAYKLSRRRLFPDEKPTVAHPAAVLHECSPYVINLLRIPADARTESQKWALVNHLEEEFAKRGAGTLRVNVMQPSPEAIQMRKYEYLMANLDALWELFPPAPDLADAAHP